MTRQQLPHNIRRIEGTRRKNGKPVVRYEILVDVTKVDGKRKRIRTRKNGDGQPLGTEAMARAELARIQNEVATDSYVHQRKTTVDQAVENWLNSRHGVKPSTLRGYKIWFQPLRRELGDIELQKLTKADIDQLVTGLKSGTVPGFGAWTHRSINGMLGRFQAVVQSEVDQDHLHKNVVRLVDRLPQDKREFRTLTREQMQLILDYSDRDRHLWALALYGLRRGEIAGLLWEHVDFDDRTLSIERNRVRAGTTTYVGTPKSKASKRKLPLPDDLYNILLDAHSRIEAPYVAVHQDGSELSENNITYRWDRLMVKLGINVEGEQGVRLHDARHTCATLMSIKGVAPAVVAAWLGHASAAFTVSTYMHSQPEALIGAGMSLGSTNE